MMPARPATPLRMGSLFMRPLLASRSGVVELTPLSFVPGTRILRYLGRINMHFIKESSQVREGGGLGGFFQLFLTEVNAMCRAHVRSALAAARCAAAPLPSPNIYMLTAAASRVFLCR